MNYFPWNQEKKYTTAAPTNAPTTNPICYPNTPNTLLAILDYY